MELKENSININKLTKEQAENLSVEIGTKVRNICDEAAEKANSILSIYGVSAKIAIVIEELSKETKKTPKKKSEKNKKAKQANL